MAPAAVAPKARWLLVQWLQELSFVAPVAIVRSTPVAVVPVAWWLLVQWLQELSFVAPVAVASMARWLLFDRLRLSFQ